MAQASRLCGAGFLPGPPATKKTTIGKLLKIQNWATQSQAGSLCHCRPYNSKLSFGPHVQMLPVGIIALVGPFLGDAQPQGFSGLIDPFWNLAGVEFVHGVPVELAEGVADGIGGAVHHPGVIEVIEVEGQTEAMVGGRSVVAVVDLSQVVIAAPGHIGRQAVALIVRETEAFRHYRCGPGADRVGILGAPHRHQGQPLGRVVVALPEDVLQQQAHQGGEPAVHFELNGFGAVMGLIIDVGQTGGEPDEARRPAGGLGHGLPFFLKGAKAPNLPSTGRHPHRHAQGDAHPVAVRPAASPQVLPGDFHPRGNHGQGFLADLHQAPDPQQALGQLDFFQKIAAPLGLRHEGSVGQGYPA